VHFNRVRISKDIVALRYQYFVGFRWEANIDIEKPLLMEQKFS